MSGNRTYQLPKTELTERELTIAILLGRGRRQCDIATELGITKVSVGQSLIRIREKLDLYGNHQVADYARAKGWCNQQQGAGV